jgi:S1-C subfamily serine protease
MTRFVYLYSGGQMAESPEEQAESMRVWTAWFGALGDAVVDIGNPFGAGSTVTAEGATTGGASKLGGYSVIEATSLDHAASQAGGCPILTSGGSVEIYEAVPM